LRKGSREPTQSALPDVALHLPKNPEGFSIAILANLRETPDVSWALGVRGDQST